MRRRAWNGHTTRWRRRSGSWMSTPSNVIGKCWIASWKLFENSVWSHTWGHEVELKQKEKKILRLEMNLHPLSFRCFNFFFKINFKIEVGRVYTNRRISTVLPRFPPHNSSSESAKLQVWNMKVFCWGSNLKFQNEEEAKEFEVLDMNQGFERALERISPS